METPGGGSPGNVKLIVSVNNPGSPHREWNSAVDSHKRIDFQRNTPIVGDNDGVCSIGVDKLLRVHYLLGLRILRRLQGDGQW